MPRIKPRDRAELILHDESGQLTLADSPLAAWLADQLRPMYRHAPGLGWLKFDGQRWLPITLDQVVVVAQHAFTELYVKESSTASPDRRRALTTLLNKSKLSAVTTLLKGLLFQDPADFDSIERAHLLNVQNGVVDLRTGDLEPHDPDLLFTKLTRAEYRRGAHHPDWAQALDAFADTETMRWVQLKMGQAITGLPPTDDMLAILYGDGSNGKSAFMECRKAVGDYASLMAERLVHSLPSHHPTELTDLKGVRLAFLEELPAGVLNTRRIKAMVGTSELSARKIGQDSMRWLATHSLFITTNHRPQVAERDHGTWRRLALVVFPHTYVVGDQPLQEGERRGDETLRDRLGAGQEGRDEAMLAWLVEGAIAVYNGSREQHLPTLPDRVRLDTQAWRGGEDKIAQFVDETLVFDEDWAALRSDVYQRYQQWAEARGWRPDNDQVFTDAFESHEQVVANGVFKAQRRFGSWKVSRPGKGSPPTKGRAWFGVRFRDDDDELGE